MKIDNPGGTGGAVEITKWYIIVDMYTREKPLFWDQSPKVARDELDRNYPDGIILKAIRYKDGDGNDVWTCGKTFGEAVKNMKDGVKMNYGLRIPSVPFK